MDLETLNKALKDYDDEVYSKLEPVLEEMREKSNALASNLKRCFDKFRQTDRYLRAFKGEEVAIKEKELKEEEFMIFREYVRLLRSCTIMCGNETSKKFKELFIDFFSGKRLELARALKK